MNHHDRIKMKMSVPCHDLHDSTYKNISLSTFYLFPLLSFLVSVLFSVTFISLGHPPPLQHVLSFCLCFLLSVVNHIFTTICVHVEHCLLLFEKNRAKINFTVSCYCSSIHSVLFFFLPFFFFCIGR